MGRRVRVGAVPFVLTLFACSDPVAVVTSENVTVGATGISVVIKNDRSANIVYMVMDAGFAARANWVPCVHADCPNVPSGDSERVPAGEIGGWRESDEVIVYWWHVHQAASGEYFRDSIRALRVRY
jgi:hypothetical protein